MHALLSYILAFLALVWTFKRFVSKRDIDNIPGPKPESFTKGVNSYTTIVLLILTVWPQEICLKCSILPMLVGNSVQ